MKMNKKKLLVSAVALCLIAILSMGTLAWFSADDEVTNEFMIATSDDTDPEDIFSIDVWENTPDGEKDQDGYEYKDILPGDVLQKEVIVENTGYYDQYVRVTVTVSDAKAWIGALGIKKVPSLDMIVGGMNADDWIDCTKTYDETTDTLIYVLHYQGILQGEIANEYDDGAATVTVFETVVIPEDMTVEQAAAFESGFEIKVVAEAVQTENLGLDPTQGDGAKEAFGVVESN